VRPIEVFDEVARVLRPGGPFVCTFSNRCFPTKAIRGWLAADDDAHLEIVREYFRRSHGWGEVAAQRRTPPAHRGDPLFAVWAHHAAV
jgi:SAM-dependent methyltransferase